MEVRIVCINKDNGNHYSHEAVRYYGWVNENNNISDKYSREKMVKWVEEGNKAYVRNGLRKVYCYVRTSINGTKFLQTYADGTYTDNLLNLPECR